VTATAGLNRVGWASSVCAAAPHDNDGWLDLFVTYYGSNVLYRNRGDGRFEDVTAKAELPAARHRWGSGCTFIDYDRDGRADLFVANYLTFDVATAPAVGRGPNCVWKGVPVNCGPRGLPTDTNLLYHNNGDGTFSDVSERSSIAAVHGRYSDDIRGGRHRRRRLARHLRGVRLDRVDSYATTRTGRSPTGRSRAAWPTAKTGCSRPAWAWRWATTTATACWIC
jgi:hypothetical protein